MLKRPGVGLAVLALFGCGTTASVREGAIEHQVRINRSTASALIVQTNEGEMTIPRTAISDIDHPGNVLAVAGVPVMAFGALNLAGLWNCGDGEPSHAFCMSSAMGIVTTSVGALMTAWGLAIWQRSRQAASAEHR